MDKDSVALSELTADLPAGVTGLDHITLNGSNEDDTLEFYRDILGLPLVLRQPNLDRPNLAHLFFSLGDGRLLTFFVSDSRPSVPTPEDGRIGSVHHVAFRVDVDEFQSVKDRLEANGYSVSVYDRSIFYSMYTRDHNGLTIEISTQKFVFPDERRGEVLVETQRIREAAGAEFAGDEHIEAALESLGLPVELNDLPDADTGVRF